VPLRNYYSPPQSAFIFYSTFLYNLRLHSLNPKEYIHAEGLCQFTGRESLRISSSVLGLDVLPVTQPASSVKALKETQSTDSGLASSFLLPPLDFERRDIAAFMPALIRQARNRTGTGFHRPDACLVNQLKH